MKREGRCGPLRLIAAHAESNLVRRLTMELTIYHWIVFAVFVGIVVWVFRPKRKARFEKDAQIPLDDKDS